MKTYLPKDNAKDTAAALAYVAAQVSAEIPSKSGDNLTRENLLEVATHLKDVRPKLLLDGLTISTSPTNYLPIKRARLVEFDGTSWTVFDDPIDLDATASQ